MNYVNLWSAESQALVRSHTHTRSCTSAVQTEPNRYDEGLPLGSGVTVFWFSVNPNNQFENQETSQHWQASKEFKFGFIWRNLEAPRLSSHYKWASGGNSQYFWAFSDRGYLGQDSISQSLLTVGLVSFITWIQRFLPQNTVILYCFYRFESRLHFD